MLSPLMLSAVALIVVCSTTSILALIGSVLDVHIGHVLLQPVCLNKALRAEVTLELSLFVVSSNVKIKIAFTGELS